MVTAVGTQVMGVVNVTPDSFSDGGAWADADAAVAHGLQLLDEGAAVLDVGGDTREAATVGRRWSDEVRCEPGAVPQR